MDNPQATEPQSEFSPQDSPAVRAARSQIDPDTAMVLTRLYWQRRIEYQLSYYQARAREYEHNVDLAFRAGAILMTFSSFLASLGIVVQNNQASAAIALATAIIPAIVSFIASFRQLYQWDRQLSLYRDTTVSLEQAKLAITDLDSLTPEMAQQAFPNLVRETESVLQQEVAQWGQIALGTGEAEDAASQRFAEEYGAALTDSEGNLNQNVLGGVSGILDAGSNVPSNAQYAPREMPAQSILLPDDVYEQNEGRRARAAAAARDAAAQSDAGDTGAATPSLPDSTSATDDPSPPDENSAG